MDGDDFAGSRYARMRWNTPLSTAHADLLLSQLDLAPGRSGLHIADAGCGWGELLLRAVDRARSAGTGTGDAAAPVTGTGLDTDAAGLERGRRRARELGLDRQVEFIQADAAAWTRTADRVMCIGSVHAFGGTGPALTGLGRMVPAGGRLLFGDGCWPAPPSAAAREIFGEQVLPLPELLGAARAAGWQVTHLSAADQEEWDGFESAFLAGRREWLATHGTDPRARAVRDWLDTREREYAEAYRGVLGFAYLILTH